ncbi:unnamed protein product [Psylliodes chrysocephalus]|uniref:Apolipoprotein D n=1 Tax=Psylliodes chrysocephalus TaxID=3402493 RepID=A0A9P0CYY9_9CUCU|nr:unnamed protein product [Psylliodes chrysocephala]
MCFLIIIASILPICLGQIPSIGHECLTPEVVQNFNVAAYLGKWYEQEKYPVIFEIGGRCITAEYSLKDDGTVRVFNKMIVGARTSSIEGSAKLNSTNGEAKLEVTFNVPFAVRSPYWVVSTDYTSYTVVWACQELFGITGSTAWILTREQNPPDSLIEKAYNILKKYQIKTQFLTKTDQKNCS